MSQSPRTGPQRPAGSAEVRRYPWWMWLAISLAVVVTLLAATLVSVGLGFGILTECTNNYGCSETDCAPCATAGTWLKVGWGVQGALFIAAIVLTVTGARGRRPGATAAAALVVCAASVAAVVATSAGATASYCNDDTSAGGGAHNLCDVD